MRVAWPLLCLLARGHKGGAYSTVPGAIYLMAVAAPQLTGLCWGISAPGVLGATVDHRVY